MTQELFDETSWEEEPSWEDPAPGPRRWPFAVLGGLVVLAALYGGAAAWAADRVPRGTTVAGVDVGGQGPRRPAPPSSAPSGTPRRCR
ncbi:hypothetical protein [Phycicoccus sp. HDW14]|uniref:hypothetical protein n=1 Tax=Phycicoccus sp. HDW14 TaxID=2714941 RepID=UPI001F1185F7|nr:hypothetical protein [Phycicoccus sp. HDW14]